MSDPNIASLRDALEAYAPARTAKLRAATPRHLAALDKLVRVPDPLRALWSLANGASEIVVTGELDEGLDLLSVADATKELKVLRKVAAFPGELVPFATDGAGNFVTMDARGRVLDWDHETRKTRVLFPSLAKLVARTRTAIDKKELFGGPEGPKGSSSPLVKRADSMLAKPVQNKERIGDLTARFPPALAKEALRIHLALRDAVLSSNAAMWREDDCLHLALRAADAAAWDEALLALAEKAKRSSYDTHDWWFVVGRKALEAGAFAHASKAFSKGDSLPAAVGALVARMKLGEKTSDAPKVDKKLAAEIARMESKIAKDAAKRPKPSPDALRYVAELHMHRAAVAMVAGDSASARAAVTTARSHCKRDIVDVSLAKAAGARL